MQMEHKTKKTKKIKEVKHEWETMNKVVLKHHEKELKMKKKAKESKDIRQYELEK